METLKIYVDLCGSKSKLPITFTAHMCVLPKSHKFSVSVFYVDFFTMNVSMTTAGNYVGHVKKTSIINRYIIKITSGWHRYSFALVFISKLKYVFSRRSFNWMKNFYKWTDKLTCFPHGPFNTWYINPLGINHYCRVYKVYLQMITKSVPCNRITTLWSVLYNFVVSCCHLLPEWM